MTRTLSPYELGVKLACAESGLTKEAISWEALKPLLGPATLKILGGAGVGGLLGYLASDPGARGAYVAKGALGGAGAVAGAGLLRKLLASSSESIASANKALENIKELRVPTAENVTAVKKLVDPQSRRAILGTLLGALGGGALGYKLGPELPQSVLHIPAKLPPGYNGFNPSTIPPTIPTYQS